MESENLSLLIELSVSDGQKIDSSKDRELSGSVVECLPQDRGARVRASPVSLRCGP